ncbi:MAG: hypothetical protein OXG42_00425 [Chloroflexi bacterium]|nr:hypothetical protein [Chloroflexota bacterium]
MSNGVLRGGIAAVKGQRARWNLAEMAVEALMVVFAVLVAFGVEEWQTERQLRQFAGVARAAVELEMQVNLDEFKITAASLRSVSERLAQVVRADSEDDPVFEERRLDLSLRLPDMTSAAWRTAQASDAAPYFDYDWVIQVSQAYDMVAAYERLQYQMLDSVTLVLARPIGRHAPA